MADSLWPHKYYAVDEDLQQERNNHGEGVLQLILFDQSIETKVVLLFPSIMPCIMTFSKLLPLRLVIWPK